MLYQFRIDSCEHFNDYFDNFTSSLINERLGFNIVSKQYYGYWKSIFLKKKLLTYLQQKNGSKGDLSYIHTTAENTTS